MVLPKLAIATVSLGRVAANHLLTTKLEAASRAGYDGVELTFECLDHHSKLIKSTADLPRPERLKEGAKDVRQRADALKLEIISIQPFMQYDALITWETRFEEAELWLELCGILGASFLQIPTAIYPLLLSEIDISIQNIASNMRRLADKAAEGGITLAYEAPAWAHAAKTWEEIDVLIKTINRPNVKHCLDTFHIGIFYAGDARSPETNYLLPGFEAKLVPSLQRLRDTLKPEDIAYFQLSDACPIDYKQVGYPNVDLSQPDLLTWSRNGRPFPFETDHGALLQNSVVDISKAVFATGFRGWVSMEVFHAEHYNKKDRRAGSHAGG
ncbi:xylose isomerase-like protein [Meredithblackwellia eburnea MCA 4105]